MDLKLTKFDLVDPPLYLGSAHLPQPYNKADDRDHNLKLLKEYGIDAILNMSVDSLAKDHHLSWYRENEIEFYQRPISDMGGFPVKDEFLDGIVELYFDTNSENQPNKKTFLVHCTMGINRSAFAAGAILWAATSPKRTGQPRQWSSPEDMINWMVQCQRRDRKLSNILGNSWLKFSLIKWCKRYD